jgi:ADP-ribose pyrophosphatase YjhB (NUDIX family)
MQNSSDIHGIQASIMRQLFFKEDLRFAELNVNAVSSDQFSYHLKQLMKWGLIEKGPDNTYKLSVLGRSRAIMLKSDTDQFIEQGFLAARIVLSQMRGDQRYFLMQKRAATPYKGTYATPGDKILFGEDVHVAAQRAMAMQTGLNCDIVLRGIKHVKDNYQGKIVQDKYFFVFSATNPRGELLPSGHTGANLWLTYEEIRDSGHSIQGGLEIIDLSRTPRLLFDEKTFVIEKY